MSLSKIKDRRQELQYHPRLHCTRCYTLHHTAFFILSSCPSSSKQFLFRFAQFFLQYTGILQHTDPRVRIAADNKNSDFSPISETSSDYHIFRIKCKHGEFYPPFINTLSIRNTQLIIFAGTIRTASKSIQWFLKSKLFFCKI